MWKLVFFATELPQGVSLLHHCRKYKLCFETPLMSSVHMYLLTSWRIWNRQRQRLYIYIYIYITQYRLCIVLCIVTSEVDSSLTKEKQKKNETFLFCWNTACIFSPFTLFLSVRMWSMCYLIKCCCKLGVISGLTLSLLVKSKCLDGPGLHEYKVTPLILRGHINWKVTMADQKEI